MSRSPRKQRGPRSRPSAGQARALHDFPRPQVGASLGTLPGLKRIARWLATLSLGATMAWGAVYAWDWYRLPDRLAARLPPAPSLAGRPKAFADTLAEAWQRAGRRGQALEGVEQLGCLFHANDFPLEAGACWQLLRERQPDEARWAYLLADLRRSDSDYDGMEELLRQVVHLAPGYAPAWLKLGDHLFKTGRAEEAQRAYLRRLALHPADPYARLGIGRVAHQAGRTGEARRLIEAITRDHPDFASAHNLLAELLQAAGDEPEAARHRQLGKAAQVYVEPEDPWLDGLIEACYDPAKLRMRATIAFYSQRAERAVALMERAARLVPDDPAGLAALGDLFIKLGDAGRARQVLEQCVQQSRSTSPAIMVYVNLSHALRQLKQPEQALAVAYQGLSAYPDAFELHDELGIVYGVLGRLDEAVASFERAIADNPHAANPNCNLALALLQLNRRAEARQALERSLVLKPTFPESLALLGQLEMAEGRRTEAEAYFRRLFESAPERPEAHRLLGAWELEAGRLAERAGDVSTAEIHYRRGVEVDPTNPELQSALGILLLVNDRVREALGPLEAFRRLEPASPQAALSLGQVYARLGRRTEAREILEAGIAEAEQAGNTTTARHCREILEQLR